MPHKGLRYYVRTIWLKTNAHAYFFLQKKGFLKAYQTRQKSHFVGLYDTCFSENKISLNPLFSTSYVAYTMFDTKAEMDIHTTFNDKDIVMCRSDTKLHYNPLMSAHYALVCYNDYLKSQNPQAIKAFWTQTNNLEKEFLATDYKHYYEWGGQVFYSGIAQSILASLFMRAYTLTKEQKWADIAYNTLKQIFVPTEKGGNLIYDTEGYVWIEEYPRLGKLSMVINGYLYALIAVYEYLILCKNDPELSTYCAQMTEALFKNLHHYKFGKYTRYSRFEKAFENIDYEGRNYFLFKHLFELTQNKAFEILMRDSYQQTDWNSFYRFYYKN
jgi:D-glucuronyl C5-epimerase C-terminus